MKVKRKHTSRALTTRFVALATAMVGAGLAPMMVPSASAISDFSNAGERAFQYGAPDAGTTTTKTNPDGTTTTSKPFWDPDNSPTASKPQSKLWYAQGKWWGVLLENGEFHIRSFDAATRKWSAPGALVDTRPKSHVDVLWDGTYLYTVGAVQRATTTSADSIQFKRFSFDAASGTYKTDLAPAPLNNGGVEAAVLAKDGHGRIWIVYTAGNNVRYMTSDNSGATFSAPTGLPSNMTAKSEGLSPDDIATVVGANDSAAIAWSRQEANNMEGLYVATYKYSGATGTAGSWQLKTLLEKQYAADDHLNMSVDGDGAGRIFLVAKTGANDKVPATDSDPLIQLWVRELSGSWTSHVIDRVSEGGTRPVVVVDRDAGKLRVFLTTPEAGGGVYERTTSLSSPGSFTPARPVIELASDNFVNNVTTTKQNVTPDTGLLVLASDQKTGYYVQNYASGGGSTPSVGPSVTMAGSGSSIARTRAVRATWSATADHYRFIRTVISTDRSDKWATTVVNTRQAGVLFEGTPGNTYCMQVRGYSAAGVPGNLSAQRCVTVPLDDRQLAKRGAWKKVTAKGAFLSTALKTTRRGATVSSTVTGKKVSLVVTKMRRGGTVKIFQGKRLVKRVSLNAKRTRPMQFITIANRPNVTTAKYRVVVISKGRTVMIDGLAVSRR